MTAIAFRSGAMAADSAVWGGSNCNTVVDHRQKIKRLADGGLFAGCGRSTDTERVAAHLMQNGTLKGLEELKDTGFNAIWAKPDGTVWWIENDLHPVLMNRPIVAAGAAEVFMLGAMHAGASAEDAVRLAIRHTDGAAGEVQVEHLHSLGIILHGITLQGGGGWEGSILVRDESSEAAE